MELQMRFENDDRFKLDEQFVEEQKDKVEENGKRGEGAAD